jgi:subtilisin
MKAEERKLEQEARGHPAHQSIASRPEQYLVGKRLGPPPPGTEPLDFNAVRSALEQDRTIRIKRTLAGPGLGPFAAAGLGGADSIIVAEMSKERAQQMSQLAQLVVEPDHPVMLDEAALGLVRDPGVVALRSSSVSITIRVLSPGQEPVEGAGVFLFGSLSQVQGVTDADGQARMTLLGESLDSVRGLYVRPKADYWSAWIAAPALDPNGANVVVVTPLDETFHNLPNQEVVGWGLRAMRLDQLPASYRGRGVKVAVLDSGGATTHQQLRAALKGGYDTITQSADTWNQDETGHGSHCAGIIAGTRSERGIRGIAPEAEIYAFKVAPDGRFSHLIDALNRCIELQVDVVNLSLGSDQYSQLLEEKLQEVKERGIACIASAGSTGGAVQFPASSPSVLAVTAIGKADEFPPGSYHAATMPEGGARGSDGYFSPRFSCAGPEVELCAPGVAILSCVPPDNYAVWDGSSVAAPHVTGLAALILAHHPDFQGPYQTRNANRVERLFQVLRQSARLLDLRDPDRTGAGLPDAVKALAPARPGEAEVLSEELVERLVAAFRASQTRPGNGAAVFQQLLGALQRAGLGTVGGISPMVSEVAPQFAPVLDPAAALQQLRSSMRQAGLLTAKQAAALAKGRRPSPVARSQPPATGQPANLGSPEAGQGRRLTDTMKRFGLL